MLAALAVMFLGSMENPLSAVLNLRWILRDERRPLAQRLAPLSVDLAYPAIASDRRFAARPAHAGRSQILIHSNPETVALALSIPAATVRAYMASLSSCADSVM